MAASRGCGAARADVGGDWTLLAAVGFRGVMVACWRRNGLIVQKRIAVAFLGISASP